MAQAHALLDDMHALVLGSDIDGVESRRLVEEYRRVCERLPADDQSLMRREDELLSVFADVSPLFLRQAGQDDGDDPTALSAGQYFLTYLRTLEGKGAGLPSAFVSELQRALRHYGSDSLEVTNALKSRLLWMFKSHQRVDQQVGVVLAILDRRLRHAHALLPFVSNGVPRHARPPHRHVRGPDPDPHGPGPRRALPLLRAADLRAGPAGHLRRDGVAPVAPDARSRIGPRAERIRALVECPVPLRGLLSGRFEDAAPVLRELMLEVLSRRFYRNRDIERCDSHEADGRSVTCAEYHHERGACGSSPRTPGGGNCPSRWTPWSASWPTSSTGSTCSSTSTCGARTAPSRRTTRPASSISMLNQTPFPAAVRRVVVAVAGPRAEWSTSGTQYFTLRRGDAGWAEDRVYRGLHPMVGKRLQVSRFERFDIERLSSVEDVYLFRIVGRENKKDERLFALAEVRDVSPVRDDVGALLQVPHLERMLLEAAAAIREVQARRTSEDRLHWNRIYLLVWPPLTIGREELLALMRRLSAHTEGLGLEKVVLRAHMADPDTGEVRDTQLSMSTAGGHGLVLQFGDPSTGPLERARRVHAEGGPHAAARPHLSVRGGPPADPVRARARSRTSRLASSSSTTSTSRARSCRSTRPFGRNTANVVVGLVRNFTPKHPEGMTRVIVLGDPSKEVGSVAEPECRRILAGLDLAERLDVPFEWFALSAGAKISMESGTENMDWIGRVLRKLIEFTQDGREVNVVVTGINVGAQPYWNAEATMLMHTKGILVMMPESAMVLTGKTALDYSGSVSAEDNLGIGGYERIMGPNGQAQYFARDLAEACRILLRHYDHTYVVRGEPFPRRAATSDPLDRDVRNFPHGRVEGAEFAVGRRRVLATPRTPDGRSPSTSGA